MPNETLEGLKTAKKINSVEEAGSLNVKIDMLMSMIYSRNSCSNSDNISMGELVEQKKNIDVNFVRNNFNDNAYILGHILLIMIMEVLMYPLVFNECLDNSSFHQKKSIKLSHKDLIDWVLYLIKLIVSQMVFKS